MFFSTAQRIAKALQATRDFNQLLRLSTSTDESRGILRPTISGDVTFDNVCFSYPERPDAPVLKNVSMELFDGECVAIVGASGSGKSTVAALLQRLYEPDSGSISIGASDIHGTDVTHLREHVAVVIQNPNLFNATIPENISYGNTTLSASDIQRAAKATNVHDFIMSLQNVCVVGWRCGEFILHVLHHMRLLIDDAIIALSRWPPSASSKPFDPIVRLCITQQGLS
jgi:ATP-binding cassette subfamily B (MDR/TAP) protein 1